MARSVTPGASKRGAGGRRPASVRPPAAAPAAPPTVVARAPRRARMEAYELAFRLALRHEYYPAGDPDVRFAIAPARETLTDLQQRGILIRCEPAALFVLRSTARRIRLSAADRTDWVSFRVEGADEHFASVGDTDPDEHGLTCLHLSNRRPGEGAPTTPAIYAERLPWLPTLVEVAIDAGDTVEAVDMVGQPVIAGSLGQDRNWQVTVGPSGALVFDAGRGQVRVDTRQLDTGRYVVRVGGRPVADGLRIEGHHPRIAALIELALSPTGVTEVGEFMFRARRTHWKYHVVSRHASGPLEGLAIAAGPNAPSDLAIPEFLGPFAERLPNGAVAQHFLSARPIPLVSRSPVRLRLSGRRQQRMTRDSVLVDPLPVPGKHQLGLLTDQDLERLNTTDRLCSEIFVYV